MIIPWQQLNEETLMNVIESFVLREGTDYGYEVSLAEKKAQVLKQIQAGKVIIVWSELHETLDLQEKTAFFAQAVADPRHSSV